MYDSDTDDGPTNEGEFGQFVSEAGILDWLTDGGATDQAETVDETPAEAETETSTERPRDPETGRFVSAKDDEEAEESSDTTDAEDDTPAEPQETDDEEQEQSDEDEGDFVLEIDDDLQAILEKYDGDVGKALKALGDSQSFIGRQANELGELRRELAEMKQILSQPQQQQQVYVGPYINDIDENPEGLVMEALQRGDGHTMEAALRAWGEVDPFGATTFLLTLQQQAAANAAQAAPAPDQSTTPYAGPTVEQAMSEVVARHPDVEQYLPQVQQVAQEFPTLRDSMRSGTPAVQAQAFEELLKIAKARSNSTETQKAVRRLVLKTQEEVRKEKSDAAVVSAKNRSAATSKSNVDAFLEAFAEATGQDQEGDWITRSNL